MFYPNSILSQFAVRKSSKGYHILSRAIWEAVELYPQEFSFDQLCQHILKSTGGKNSKSLQRILNRTVESIWSCEYNQELLEKIFQYRVEEKISAKDFIFSFAEYYIQHPELRQSPFSLVLLPTESSNVFTTPQGQRYFVFDSDKQVSLQEVSDVLNGTSVS